MALLSARVCVVICKVLNSNRAQYVTVHSANERTSDREIRSLGLFLVQASMHLNQEIKYLVVELFSVA